MFWSKSFEKTFCVQILLDLTRIMYLLRVRIYKSLHFIWALLHKAISYLISLQGISDFLFLDNAFSRSSGKSLLSP